MIEIPRWVHREGSSCLVETLADLRTAEAEGWRVNPNEPDVCYASEAPVAPVAEPEDAPEPVDDAPAEAQEDAVDAGGEPDGAEADDKPKRKAGRPKKGG